MLWCLFSDRYSLVWRTSTPEPVSGDGIIWTYVYLFLFASGPSHVEFVVVDRYVKDVTRYLPLFATDGTFIFELDNILTDVDTGQYAGESSSLCSASSQHPRSFLPARTRRTPHATLEVVIIRSKTKHPSFLQLHYRPLSTSLRRNILLQPTPT